MIKTLNYEELLQGCESEKLHLSGYIQSFGAIIRIEQLGHKITHVSSNIKDYVGISAEELLSKRLETFAWGLEPTIEKIPKRIGASAIFLSGLSIEQRFFDLFFHVDDGGVLIEIQNPTEGSNQALMHKYQSELLHIPNSDSEQGDYGQLLCDSIHQVSGFERVMIYKFLEDWSGEVIAEYATEEIGSYFGLRFPASDIPAIARNIYMLNPSRLISDVQAKPVEIISLSGKELDLTYSDLRSVSPVHLEYLNNMGVNASFSIPIKISGVLWGLLACHNSTPKYMSIADRNCCVTLAQSYSIGVSAFKASKRLHLLDSMDKKIEHAIEAVTFHEDILDGIKNNVDILLELMDSGGLAMAIESEIILVGTTPSLEFMSELDSYVSKEYSEVVYVDNNLGERFKNAVEFAKDVSGVIAIKVKSSKSGNIRFFWFRPEQTTEVLWAGNPDKPVNEDPNATALSPRRSFEKWVQIKHGFSRPWNTEHKTIALKFRNTLLRWM